MILNKELTLWADGCKVWGTFMPGGRPTDYRPEYCTQVLEFCKNGKSLAAFCDEIGITRSTLHLWRDTHAEFSEACSRALLAAQRWFEAQCERSLGDRNFNSRLAEFQMAARFEDYRPQAQRIELTGAGGGAILIGKSVSDADLLRLAGPVLEAELVQRQLPAASEGQAGQDTHGNLPESTKPGE